MIRNLVFGSGRMLLLSAAAGAIAFALPSEASARHRRCCCRYVYYQPACPQVAWQNACPPAGGPQSTFYRGPMQGGLQGGFQGGYYDAQGNWIAAPPGGGAGVGAEFRSRDAAPAPAPANGQTQPPPAPERSAPPTERRDRAPGQPESAPSSPRQNPDL